jgi:hypothetical protein
MRGVVNEIINAIKFEEINKVRAIEIILWNKARGTALPGIFEKGHAEDGEVNGRDCLIHR